MNSIITYLWLIPVLPLVAAGIIAISSRSQRTLAASLAVGTMVGSTLLSIWAMVCTLGSAHGHGVWRATRNFDWLQIGAGTIQLGWMLDPLTAVMLVMVSFVSTLIFIYSIGYMLHDANFTRFFCFLSLFAAAMLGLVIANSLLLFFACWELVGLASYLLIGFWFHKPSAAAAAKKAFITTRIGDIGFLIGMLWLYADSGTLLFYNGGSGCLEQTALSRMSGLITLEGMAVSTVIGLLIFCGAVGKSGQFPLHVWLPDAMEGPTPVSALIHAATMVAAGVFLMARIYPILEAASVDGISTSLSVVAWVGAITAVFAALIAIAQSDIKRILAYSTVSQLGYMMMALGVGGYVAAVFHLITHAFFKALLFLGAGSVIHGCHEQQDIRFMGGLKQYMPVTFLTYAIGMMALAGVPVFFSGFWSKDEILHAAFQWKGSSGPFFLGLFGAFLTAFYMTRQVCYVFWGEYRGASHGPGEVHSSKKPQKGMVAKKQNLPHESPLVMTVPLQILAVGAVLLGFLGTPAWPWFHNFLSGHVSAFDLGALFHKEVIIVMLMSVGVVAVGIGSGWVVYGDKFLKKKNVTIDPLEKLHPDAYTVLRDKFRIDELYEVSLFRLNRHAAAFCSWLDQYVWNGFVQLVQYITLALSWFNRFFDEYVINLGFDATCREVRNTGGLVSRLQDGQIHHYLRVIAIALTLLVLILAWGWKS